jgi:hypothetical protein
MENLKILNSFEFETGKNGEYPSYYPADISIQYGNIIEAVRCEWRYCISMRGYKPNLLWGEKMRTLKEAGIEFNVSDADIKKLYKKGVQVIIDAEDATRHKKKREDYKASWIHTAIAEIEAMNINGLTAIANTTEDEYANGNISGRLYVRISLKRWSGTVEPYTPGYGSTQKRGFTFPHDLNNYSGRRYTKLSTAVNKFVEAVENKIRETEANERIKQERAAKNADKYNKLCKVFDNVIQDKKWVSSGRSGYSVDVFKTKINEQTVTIGIYEHNNKTTYSFGSFTGLTSEKVRAMQNLLRTV